MSEYAIRHCVSCGSTDLRGFMATEDVANVECASCELVFNVDDIAGHIWGNGA